MKSLRLVVLGSVSLLLAACGGGGGGPRDGGSNQNFSISSNSVTFEADVNGGTPAPQAINGSITGVNSTVYLFVTLTNTGITNASVQLTSDTTGQLTIFPRSPAQLGLGTFTDTVQLRACLDPNCAQQVSGSPKTISVTYNVRGLRATPGTVNLSAFEGLSSNPVQISLNNGTTSTWTSSISYQGAAGWLTLAPATGPTGQQTLTFTGGARTPGNYSATVTVTAGASTLNIPVTYVVAPNLMANPTSVTLNAVTGQIAPAPSANVALSTAVGATSFTTSIAYGPGASGWLAVTGTTAPGALVLTAQTVALAPATYTATVTLTPTNGATPIPLPVTYTLAGSQLTLTPASPSFSIDASSTSASTFLQRTIATGDTGAPLTWTTSESSPWLQVTASGTSGQSATLTLVPAALESLRNGTHQAEVMFVYTGPSVTHQARLIVELALDLPTISYAMPHVAYLNESKPIVIRGSGFDQPGLGPVMFGSTPVASYQTVSDTEIRVTPPAIASASRPVISLSNNLGVSRTSAELVVRAKPDYGTQTYPFSVGAPTGWRVLYDAERDLVFALRAGFGDPPHATLESVLRFELDPDGGGATFTYHTFVGISDIALSPNGKVLYVLTSTEMHFLDPATMTAIQPARPMPSLSGSSGRLAVANDGTIVLPWLHRLYWPDTDTFETIGASISDGHITASADGSKLVYNYLTSGLVRLGTYDAGTREFVSPDQEHYSSVLSVDRSGTRFAHGGDVFNIDASVYGAAGQDGYFSRLSPAGDRLYAIAFSPTRLLTFDTTVGTTPFPSLPDIDDLTFGTSAMGISLNGEHVFIVAEGHLVVVAAP